MGIKQIGPLGLKELLEGEEVLLIDVRESHEVAYCKIEGSVHLPLRQIREAEDRFSIEARVVVYCHHGPRSMLAAQVLQAMGFQDVTNLEGGIEGWSVEVDPEVPRY